VIFAEVVVALADQIVINVGVVYVDIEALIKWVNRSGENQCEENKCKDSFEIFKEVPWEEIN
jgi:hypothetical protein